MAAGPPGAPNHRFVSEFYKQRVQDYKRQFEKYDLKLDEDVETLKLAELGYAMNWACRTEDLKGKKEFCKAFTIYHPAHFVIILKNKYNLVDWYMDELTDFYTKNAESEYLKMDNRDNVAMKGLYVAALVVFNPLSDPREFWHRAYILEICHDGHVKGHKGKKTSIGHSCKVLLIDYGRHVILPMSKIRRIPEKVLNILPAQAIKCSLLFDDNAFPLNSEHFLWTKNECSKLRNEILKLGMCMVEFVDYEEERNKCLPYPIYWKIRAQAVDGDWTVPDIKDEVDKELLTDKFLSVLQDGFKSQQVEIKDLRMERDALGDPWNFLRKCNIHDI